MGAWYWSPVFIMSAMFLVIAIILFQFYATVPLFAFVVAGFVMFVYIAVMNVTGKVTGWSKNPDWIKGRNIFMRMRITLGGTLLLGWTYMCTFFLFPKLQILFSILYVGGVFLLKYAALLITHSTLSKEHYGLGSLSTEFYHSTFLLFAFPSVSGWDTFAIAVVVQLFSTVMMWISITPFWCKFLTKVVSVLKGKGKSKNKTSPNSVNTFQSTPPISASQENLLHSYDDIEKKQHK
eukprot:TRINITY_DN1701_c0_g1_i1.p1 TRINITY_DN1701_c0_g1~~TRINITY_DN1701_c0_g1_i1.p1  ORF type:complete len:236 (-),score=35.07 TRINITY_DN1701_c0_g1_i1:392-1099(-)